MTEQLNRFASAARCGARTRAGTPCRAPAVGGAGRCRMHGGAGSGAPAGNRNAFTDGFYGAEEKARRRKLNAFIRYVTGQVEIFEAVARANGPEPEAPRPATPPLPPSPGCAARSDR